MSLGERRTQALVDEVVNHKEAGFLGQLLDLLHRTKKGTIIQQELDKEAARLDPKGKYDHEEVFAGTGQYTSGRKDRAKPRLNQIKSEKWVNDGK